MGMFNHKLFLTGTEKIRGVSKEVKIKTLENYWPIPDKSHSDKARDTNEKTDHDNIKTLVSCNNSFWHSKVQSVQEVIIVIELFYSVCNQT